MHLEYWTKQDKPLYQDLEWNFPEQKTGTVSVIGGSSTNFSVTAKTSEYLSTTYPISRVETYLPDSLRDKVPAAPGINFVPSTESGSIDKSKELNMSLETADFGLLAGEMSKNSATSIAAVEAIKGATCPVLLARDAVDLVTPEIGAILEDHPLFILASMTQLQKIFRSVLYPKMLLLTQPLMPTVETLHKFTLSYSNCTIITLREDQIIVASHGQVITTALRRTKFSPLTFFTGTLPADLVAYNLWNPGKPLEASSAAMMRS